MTERHLIIGIFIACILICGAVQAATLRISVVDEKNGDSLAGHPYSDGGMRVSLHRCTHDMIT